jgi:hypothetical protein
MARGLLGVPVAQPARADFDQRPAMSWRVIFFTLSAVLVVAHVTGHLRWLIDLADFGSDVRLLPYVLAIPFVFVVGLVLLRDER